MKPEERLGLNMEWMDYMLMNHYGWTLNEVHNLGPKEAKQAVAWAIAMNKEEPRQNDGEVIRLGYDRVPDVI